MKATITATERQRIVAWIADATRLLAGFDDLEARIAETLAIDPDTREHEAITDACHGAGTADDLLERLHIDVEDESA